MNSWTSSVPLKLEEQKTTQFCLESICIVFVCFSTISIIELRDSLAAAYRSIRRFTEHFASSGRALGVVIFEFAQYFLIFFIGSKYPAFEQAVQPAVDSSARRTLYVE